MFLFLTKFPSLFCPPSSDDPDEVEDVDDEEELDAVDIIWRRKIFEFKTFWSEFKIIKMYSNSY